MGSLDGTRRIGRFTVERTLGNGGMGKVYLCRTPAGLRLAVKVISTELAHSRAGRIRFHREVEALRDVRSPYTLPLYDAQTLTPPYWLASRYVEGPTLDQHVRKRGPLPERRVAELGAMLAEALAGVHAHGLIHRDLKPSNIILEDGEPRLIDFGIVRSDSWTRGLTDPLSPPGTNGFIPAESLRGGEPTPAVDVFALGVVLVFAATGLLPFGHGLPATLRIYQGVPPRLAGVPTALAGIVRSCLSPAPADRPGPEQLMAELGALMKPPPGAGPPAPKPPRQRTVPVADPPHHCHAPVPPAAGGGCALRPVAARLLAAGLTRPLIRKAVLHREP
ncbi:serine/threonine-protein kinase [Streptomyces sp. NPDC051909]|uniref:serine/threonine-protein kinase n=1 Tax=Streptomyces sp. NPDC051909 TaxID=3154944 RepID=UPI0034345C0F